MTEKPFRPMQADKAPEDLMAINYPVYGSINYYKDVAQQVRSVNMDLSDITRLEIIDHRKDAPDYGRLPPQILDFSYQDDGRTLKIFINDKESESQL